MCKYSKAPASLSINLCFFSFASEYASQTSISKLGLTLMGQAVRAQGKHKFKSPDKGSKLSPQIDYTNKVKQKRTTSNLTERKPGSSVSSWYGPWVGSLDKS